MPVVATTGKPLQLADGDFVNVSGRQVRFVVRSSAWTWLFSSTLSTIA